MVVSCTTKVRTKAKAKLLSTALRSALRQNGRIERVGRGDLKRQCGIRESGGAMHPGAELKKLRKASGKTQEAVADACDVTHIAVQGWERGAYKPCSDNR